VERIVAASPGPDVLDVGCGTGIAARQFQAAGCRVLGVDPDARMADLTRQSGIEVEEAKFEAWDPPVADSTRSSPDRPGTGWTR
jgi:SAM-dependent methyltransferase